ncbi:MAG: hypothetical protein B6I37_06145 [Desulfobacteraceae bacterium 4572_35.2]|nr:MAG: hypothetical protein B6I37_06145 [Desulfobacteraceae bacterium 4572_35.2]
MSIFSRLKESSPIFLAIMLPGSGHLVLGRPARGFILLLWMVVMGFITYNLSDENTSFIGRYSGGFAILILSVLDIDTIIRKRKQQANTAC